MSNGRLGWIVAGVLVLGQLILTGLQINASVNPPQPTPVYATKTEVDLQVGALKWQLDRIEADVRSIREAIAPSREPR